MVFRGVREDNSPKYMWPRARKALRIEPVPVPQTDTGRQAENSKANGSRVVKELGKLTPYLREKECAVNGEPQ